MEPKNLKKIVEKSLERLEFMSIKACEKFPLQIAPFKSTDGLCQMPSDYCEYCERVSNRFDNIDRCGKRRYNPPIGFV